MEEREKVLKKAHKATEEPDVEAHRALRRDDDSPTVEREKVIRAGEDDEPDVEGHLKFR